MIIPSIMMPIRMTFSLFSSLYSLKLINWYIIPINAQMTAIHNIISLDIGRMMLKDLTEKCRINNITAKFVRMLIAFFILLFVFCVHTDSHGPIVQ